MQTIDAAERRARLARRHRLAPSCRAADVVEAARSMVCLHATDPSTVYLSAAARVTGLTVADVDRALYHDRSLVKHMAMRRTLFVVPLATLPWAQAACSDAVADRERRRLTKDVEAGGLHRDGARWLRTVSDQVLGALAGGRQATFSELRAELPLLDGALTYGEGKTWGGQVAVGPRVLTILSAAGLVVRASNDGGWTSSRPRWALMKDWLGGPIDACSAEDGTVRMVEAWLRAFGPGTEADIKWWLGSTLAAVRRALAALQAVEVTLDTGIGYLLPDDLAETDPVEPWAALLPSLDPTTMGWFERDWYLGPHRPQLFDTNGNAGPTAWYDGRVVGGWRQNGSGEVVVQLLEDIGAEGRQALEREAAHLTAWLDSTRVVARFPSPLSKQSGDAEPPETRTAR